MELIRRAEIHGDRLAISRGASAVSYADLLHESGCAARVLLDGLDDLAERRVAFLTPRDESYVVSQWAIWRAGGIAVPLCELHPAPELDYVINDADAEIIVAHPSFADRLGPIARARGIRFLNTSDLHDTVGPLPAVREDRRAMIVYTSGTTGRPKGAVTTHRNIRAQVEALVEAWRWTANDHTLLVLPLHHVHGIVNVVTCALWSGAVCEVLPAFDAHAVWDAFERGLVNVFMAVPTIYTRLIGAYSEYPSARRERLRSACSRMRLMVSGSAALPVQTLERWRDISGHVLLERYGMTEMGMALSNPLEGERRPGFVGGPLPGVQVRLMDEGGVPVADGTAGELVVRGANVFSEYWRREQATREAFLDGWFRTGDIAVLERGSYRLLGRKSVDIIKSGGFKVSALEVESALRDMPAVGDVAVVGVADDTWGEAVCAAVVVREGHALSLGALRAWCREQMAPYKIPARLLVVKALPRNVLGKVTKPAVTAWFKPDSER